MATQVQRRRGTTAQNAAFTGVEGEVTLDTQTHRLITHDGATIGGFILAGLQVANIFSAVQTINVASGALSLPLDIQVDGLSRASINNQGYLSLLRQEADTGISGIDVFKRGTTGNALAAVSASSGIGGFNFRAWQGAAFSGTVAAMRAFAAETFTAAAQGTFIVLSTAQIGTTVLSENVRFQTLASGSFVSFGGTSSSFPALKRSGTQLLVRLADDSADAGFQAGATTLSGLLQFAGTTHAGIRVNNLTTAQRDAIAAPVDGMLIFNSTTSQFEGYDSGWGAISGGGSSPPFADSTELVAGSVDPTKLLRFEVDGLTTATTRVLTPQNSDYVIAGTNIVQTFTATQNFGDLSFTGILNGSSGSDLTPSYSFTADGNSGIFLQSADNIGFAAGGFETFRIGLTSIQSFVLHLFKKDAIGATPTAAAQLINTTAAAAGAQQYSPALQFTGQGWKTNATAGSQSVDWRIYTQPVQGTANPTSTLLFESSVNGAAFVSRLTVSSLGAVSVGSTVTAFGFINFSSNDYSWSSRSIMRSPADGQITFTNAAATDFTRLNFGGITSSFPAITRSGTGFIFNLADGTGSSAITTGNHTMTTAALLSINSGTNQRAGNAVLVAGTITVGNTTVTANTIVMLTRKTSGGTIGTAITYTVSAGTSFTITSDSVLDTSTFSYLLIEVP